MNLGVAEQFYSIQGEGRYSGVPAVFLRLAGCNLLCGGAGTDKDKQLHNGATWRCDTIEVWRKGRGVAIRALLEQWMTDNTFRHLRNGAHLVVTGGEPLLQQHALGYLFEELSKEITTPFIEIETNGTIEAKLETASIIRYNCSPKLSNSGMTAEQRKVVLSPTERTDFKFVISHERDIAEVIEIVQTLKIANDKVFLMPATDNRASLLETSQLVADACKKFYFNFTSRHQVMIWDKTTGV